MLTIVDCIIEKHNLWLVLAAAAICTLSVAAMMQAFNRAMDLNGRARAGWVAIAGAVGGSGIWATHFIGMLAYSPDLPIRYDLPGTALSLLIGAVGVALGLSIAGRRKPIAGGLVTGAAVAALHYSGMLAIRMAAEVQWNWPYVVGSVMASLGLSALAFFLRSRGSGVPRQVGAGGLMVLAVVALHFTGMTAVRLAPDLSIHLAREEISRPALAAALCGMVVMILLVASGLVMLETRSRRTSLGALKLAFQGVPSAVALYDVERRLVLWNEAFETLMTSLGVGLSKGLARDTLMRSTLMGMKTGGTDGRIDYEDAVDDPDQPWEGALPDGRWLNIQRRRLPDGSIVSVLSDITDQHRWAAAMQDARDRAEAANRAKSEFLANMSHEIRTPLNGVLGMIQVMERDALEPRQRDRLEVAHQSGRALLTILNDILDHAKIEASQVAFEIAPFDLSELASSVCAAFSGAASVKGLSIAWQVDAAAAGWWSGDAGKLRQILSNLIANALKFTSKGGVDLLVSEKDGGLVFQVRDTGIGVAQEDAERLFEKFAQADGSTSRKFGGTGLGLSICRGLADLMGGSIRMESRLGEGSRLIVTLPLARAAAPRQAEAQRAAQGFENDRRLSILVAEDNPVNQIVIRAMLEPLGADVTVVDGGREAIDAFRTQMFDIILMDIQMPEMNGVEATRAIRRVEGERGGARTPIVALTANVMAEQLDEYTVVGFDAHVSKPIEVDRLYAVISSLFSFQVTAAA